jgi:hypothetical protein
METALIICVVGVVGAGIGWFLLKRRQRNKRRRVFLAFMAQWKSEVESSAQAGRLANDFNVKVHSFFREADNLRQDFRGGPMQAAFEGAYQAVTAAGNQITAQNERGELVGRANVVSAFDAIIALVERN